MVGYYIISGILFLFFVGTGCIVYDIIYNKEKEIFIRKHETVKLLPTINDDVEIISDLFED